MSVGSKQNTHQKMKMKVEKLSKKQADLKIKIKKWKRNNKPFSSQQLAEIESGKKRQEIITALHIILVDNKKKKITHTQSGEKDFNSLKSAMLNEPTLYSVEIREEINFLKEAVSRIFHIYG